MVYTTSECHVSPKTMICNPTQCLTRYQSGLPSRDRGETVMTSRGVLCSASGAEFSCIHITVDVFWYCTPGRWLSVCSASRGRALKSPEVKVMLTSQEIGTEHLNGFNLQNSIRMRITSLATLLPRMCKTPIESLDKSINRP